MFDLREIGDKHVWANHLEPLGSGDHTKEDFQTWWERNNGELNHLPQNLVEQWIYRHWKQSIASFVPIKTLTCREEKWPPKDCIDKVGTIRGNEPLNPEDDFKMFCKKTNEGKLSPTAEALNQGQWDFPLVVLETPDGFIDKIGEHITTDYFLVEGHKRRRYLNALINKSISITDQPVLILNSPCFS
ncbi:hypothetical protein [Epibacterium ulvae]|uniref:hypothetical protein n=1 Tax=Epibacterium ulvae TaxID=1156985 RepID=UPI002491AA2E|nr:hypothetical protein [Epibacterium ulvae]